MKYTLYFFAFLSTVLAKTVYIIPIQGTIDLGLPPFIERVISEAEENNADGIIFDIDTFGGRVDAATQIKDAVLDAKLLTVAFINRRAISAGALISLSCEKIFITGIQRTIKLRHFRKYNPHCFYKERNEGDFNFGAIINLLQMLA